MIDYKTGKAPARKQVEQGLRLQVPVYMMAASALLGTEADTGEYLPVSQPVSPLVLPDKKSSREELFAATEQFILRYAAGIRSGQFPPRPVVACPDYCLSRTFCRKAGETDSEGTEEIGDE